MLIILRCRCSEDEVICLTPWVFYQKLDITHKQFCRNMCANQMVWMNHEPLMVKVFSDTRAQIKGPMSFIYMIMTFSLEGTVNASHILYSPDSVFLARWHC